MTDNAIDVKQHRGLRQWRGTGKNRTLAGRWSRERVADLLKDTPNHEFSVQELAKLVYGTNGKTNRDNARKHITVQRIYMMAQLTPFVTKYGPRGVIESIKLYVATEHDDREKMESELRRMEDRKEMSAERIEKLRTVLSLPAPEQTSA